VARTRPLPDARSLTSGVKAAAEFDWLAHGALHAVSHQGVEARALVHLVEVRQRLPLVQHAAAVAAPHRRAVGVVQRPFHQVARRQQVLQALLVLDADRRAPEVVGDPHGRDIHLALLEDLPVRQV
jgi:hypothetical protein